MLLLPFDGSDFEIFVFFTSLSVPSVIEKDLSQKQCRFFPSFPFHFLFFSGTTNMHLVPFSLCSFSPLFPLPFCTWIYHCADHFTKHQVRYLNQTYRREGGKEENKALPLASPWMCIYHPSGATPGWPDEIKKGKQRCPPSGIPSPQKKKTNLEQKYVHLNYAMPQMTRKHAPQLPSFSSLERNLSTKITRKTKEIGQKLKVEWCFTSQSILISESRNGEMHMICFVKSAFTGSTQRIPPL